MKSVKSASVSKIPCEGSRYAEVLVAKLGSQGEVANGDEGDSAQHLPSWLKDDGRLF